MNGALRTVNCQPRSSLLKGGGERLEKGQQVRGKHSSKCPELCAEVRETWGSGWWMGSWSVGRKGARTADIPQGGASTCGAGMAVGARCPGAVGGHRAGLAVTVPWFLSRHQAVGGRRGGFRSQLEPAGTWALIHPSFPATLSGPRSLTCKRRGPRCRRREVSQSFPDVGISPGAPVLSPLISHLRPDSALGRDGDG